MRTDPLQPDQTRARSRLWLEAFAAGLIGFALSCLLEWPSDHCWNLGVEYERMSADPFGCVGAFPHRVLGPTVAWLLGLGGERYWVFSHACSVLLLVLMYAFARTRLTLLEAGLVVAVIALTRGFNLYRQVTGYPDMLSMSLLVLGMIVVRQRVGFWVVVALGLLNHELYMLFVPWLVLRRWQARGRSWSDLVGFVVAAGLFAAVYLLTHRAAAPDGGGLSASFYVQAVLGNVPNLLGMWLVALPLLTLSFGLVTMLWFVEFFAGRRSERWQDAAFVGALLATALFAVDLWRFVAFAVIPIYLGACLVARTVSGQWLLVGLTTASVATVGWQEAVATRLFEEMLRHYPNEASAIVPHVVPRLWLEYSAVVGSLVLMGLAAFWLSPRLVRDHGGLRARS